MRKVRTVQGVDVREGSENIFADLGLPDAEDHFVKAQLVFQIEQIMKARKLSQRAAAKVMGITQPDVSNMTRGRFRGYSIERILSFLQALDQDIEIVVRPKAHKKAGGRIIVKAA